MWFYLCLFLPLPVNKLEHKPSQNQWVYLGLVQQKVVGVLGFFSFPIFISENHRSSSREPRTEGKRGLNLRLNCVWSDFFTFLWWQCNLVLFSSFCIKKKKSNSWKKMFVYPLITPYGIWVWFFVSFLLRRPPWCAVQPGTSGEDLNLLIVREYGKHLTRNLGQSGHCGNRLMHFGS